MRKPFYGRAILANGLSIDWLRFAETMDEAIRIVMAQMVHVVAMPILSSTPYVIEKSAK